MENEKYLNVSGVKYSNESPPYDDPARIVEAKGVRIGEAADLYGDIGTAEDYGYVTRG